MIILGMIIGFISFTFLCEGFNKMDINVLEGLQKKTRNLGKNKKLWQYGIFLVVEMVALMAAVMAGFGYLPQGFLIGSIWAFIDFIFEESFFDKLRNNLR